MNNFIINTDEANDLWLYSNCTTCGSCGDLWCECWGGCSLLQCKYGPNLIDRYNEDREDTRRWYAMLVELGIENPHTMDVERIKQLANILIYEYIPTKGNIKDVISHHYNNLKDDEEE